MNDSKKYFKLTSELKNLRSNEKVLNKKLTKSSSDNETTFFKSELKKISNKIIDIQTKIDFLKEKERNEKAALKEKERNEKAALKEKERNEKAALKEKERQNKLQNKKDISDDEIYTFLNEKYVKDNDSELKYNETFNRVELNGTYIERGMFSIIKSKIREYYNYRKLDDNLFKYVLTEFSKKYKYKTKSNDSWRNELVGRYLKNGDFEISDVPANYRLIMKNLFDGEFSFNEFFNDICFNGFVIDDAVRHKLTYVIGNEYDGKLHKQPFIDAALYELSNERSYHPHIPKLEKLVWDGTPRVERAIIDWFKTLPEYEDIYKQFTKKFFVAIINRIYNPGCVFQSMPIIITDGGTGKDLFISAIMKFFFDGKNKYYAEGSFKGVDDKDTIQLLQQCIIVNFGEMKNFCNKDNESIKAFMTRTFDNARFSYRRDVQQYNRHCVFYGSTNSRILFNDYTSPHDRRYWPIESTLKEGENAKYIDIFMEKNQQRYPHTEEEYKERDYYIEQLWAEAVYLFKHDFNIGINDIDLTTFTRLQNKYKTTTVETNYENINIALNHLYWFDKKDIHGDWTFFENEFNWTKQINYTDEDADTGGKNEFKHLNYLNIIPLNWVKRHFNLHSNDNNYYENLLDREWKVYSKTYNGSKNLSKMLVRIDKRKYDNKNEQNYIDDLF